jgi:hypothetical protein
VENSTQSRDDCPELGASLEYSTMLYSYVKLFGSPKDRLKTGHSSEDCPVRNDLGKSNHSSDDCPENVLMLGERKDVENSIQSTERKDVE